MNALAGRTIIITRAADQSASMSELVSSFEAVPLIVPLIEIVDEPNGMAQLASMDVGTFDWIVVTSPNGAERVAASIASDTSVPRLAAVGSTTAAALPRCDLVASTQSAAGLLDVFPSGPGRVLVVQAIDAEPTMVQGLRDTAWEVVAISPYRTISATPSADLQRAALAADAVLFASGSAVRAWVQVFGTQMPLVAVAIGEQTGAAAERAGLKISAISADHSVYGMLVTLSRYFAESN